MRSTARVLLVLAMVGVFMLHPRATSVASAIPNFPTFTYDRVVLDPANLQYNPTNEIIFPSVIRAATYFDNPLGTFYLYYAPHDAPGGINLAYANSLEGPWTEYASNPIISNTWSPHYSVSHVSSPHALWITGANKLFLWFHGENSVTRYASSTNGISFSYEGVAVTTGNFSGITEASYARVFAYTIPSKNNKYIMLLMGNNGGTRKIYLAWSNDARTWTTRTTPLISPSTTPNEGGQLAAPFYFPWNGRHYVVYATGTGDPQVTEVGANFDQEAHLGVLYDSSTNAPEFGRASHPFFYTTGTTIYMFYEAGQRLNNTKIALAKASTGTAGTTTMLDNTQAGVTFSGDWPTSTKYSNRQGADYRHDGNTAKGSKTATFRPNLPADGNYEVQVWWPGSDSQYASRVPIEIRHSGSVMFKTANQRLNAGQWNTLGTYSFNAGTGGSVVIGNTGTNGFVVADAVRFVRRTLP